MNRRAPKVVDLTYQRLRDELIALIGSGSAGPPGADGADGTDGVDGADGADGAAWAIYSATVTTANERDKESTVAHVGMTSSATLRAWLKAGDDSDENNADMLPETVVAAFPGTDVVTISLVSSIPMSGPVKVAYEVLA